MAGKIESAPKADNIDWETETALDESLLKEAEQRTRDSSVAGPIKTSDCRILITGDGRADRDERRDGARRRDPLGTDAASAG